MKNPTGKLFSKTIFLVSATFVLFFSFSGYVGNAGYGAAYGKGKSSIDQSTAPVPLLKKGDPVEWWFVFKFNGAVFPGCGGSTQRECLFGGEVQNYESRFGQQFVYASSENPSLQKGAGCVGDTLDDPVGATFDEIYNGSYFYVVWNDQFYDDPPIKGCTKSCAAPWGHSKGILAWNQNGDGLVMQVSTPSWPASGSKSFPRKDGNTLGCVEDNNVKVSQHFFGLKLNKNDVAIVLKALRNASVVTDPANDQIVHNGGPAEVKTLVNELGKKSQSTTTMKVRLSSGVELISKPSGLHVPPWQLVSESLNGLPLRTATWWANPKIYSTTKSTKITCWDDTLTAPGPVQIATTGKWGEQVFGFQGGPQPDANHAKLGVSTDPSEPYSIFGDLNQQGALFGEKCSSSQNGRGGTFYIINNKALYNGLTDLIQGGTADVAP